MNLWQVNQAIENLCADVHKCMINKNWQALTESQIVHIFTTCILGSGVKYEMALVYSDAIINNDLLIDEYLFDLKRLKNRISSLLHSDVTDDLGKYSYNRYRYPNKAANYLSESIYNIYKKYNSMGCLLDKGFQFPKLRRKLIDDCPGIGPKQASHFLNSIRYGDEIAVIDRHILKYMEMAMNTTYPVKNLGSIDFYEELEKQYVQITNKFQYSTATVDQAMWFIMRNLGKGALT